MKTTIQFLVLVMLFFIGMWATSVFAEEEVSLREMEEYIVLNSLDSVFRDMNGGKKAKDLELGCEEKVDKVYEAAEVFVEYAMELRDYVREHPEEFKKKYIHNLGSGNPTIRGMLYEIFMMPGQEYFEGYYPSLRAAEAFIDIVSFEDNGLRAKRKDLCGQEGWFSFSQEYEVLLTFFEEARKGLSDAILVTGF